MDEQARQANLRRFNRLSISVHDIDKCLKILEELSISIENSEIHDAALSYAIILYSKPFTNNNCGLSKATPSVKDKELLRQLSSQEVELHTRLIKLRHEALAHAEWDRYPTGLSASGVIQSRRFSIQAELQASRGDVLQLAQKLYQLLDSERTILYHSLL